MFPSIDTYHHPRKANFITFAPQIRMSLLLYRPCFLRGQNQRGVSDILGKKCYVKLGISNERFW